MREILALAAFGAVGSVSRYYLSGWAYRALGERFAYGTLAVNVLGCFLLGLLMELGLETTLVPTDLRLPLTVGFLGALTTFSTFGYETLRYIEDGAVGAAALNVILNLLLGVGATWLGFVGARMIAGGT